MMAGASSQFSDFIFPTRTEFHLSWKRQKFSLPSTIVYHFTRNPSTPKVYKKLIQTCKFFYIKFPIFVFLESLSMNDDGYLGWSSITGRLFPDYCLQRKDKKSIKIEMIEAKFWPGRHLYISDPSWTSRLNLYKCCVKVLHINHQILTMEEFMFLCANVDDCSLFFSKIMLENDHEVPVEEVIAVLPKLKQFKWDFPDHSGSVTSNTAKQLLKIPHFKNLIRLRLLNVPECFDVVIIYEFLKRLQWAQMITSFYYYQIGDVKKQMSISIFYHQPLSDAKKSKFEALVDEIIETNWNNFVLYFPSLSQEKKNIMWEWAST